MSSLLSFWGMVIWALHLPEDVNGGFEAPVAGLIKYLNLDIGKPVSSLVNYEVLPTV